tara:strand:+ start:72270 stop:72380 length:111 start_codon:yes stop_codon:yes gene_type:complete
MNRILREKLSKAFEKKAWKKKEIKNLKMGVLTHILT